MAEHLKTTLTPQQQRTAQIYLTLDYEEGQIPLNDMTILKQLLKDRKAVVDHVIRTTAGRHEPGQIETALKEAGLL